MAKIQYTHAGWTIEVGDHRVAIAVQHPPTDRPAVLKIQVEDRYPKERGQCSEEQLAKQCADQRLMEELQAVKNAFANGQRYGAPDATPEPSSSEL